jgi:ABC-2 type transport system ATP-binding protein
MSPTQAPPAISVRGLRKAFGDHVVLDGIDLDVASGSVFALLGPNGAGKTTIVHILSTLIAADDGAIRIGGHDVRTEPGAVRAVIGLTGQFSAVDQLFSGRENLRLMADLRHLGREAGRARVEELLAQFDLVEAAGRPVATYSGGMRRRLDLAMTLVGEPRIIFLDEPTAGLDPRSRRALWDTIRDLAGQGVTILLTTQYLDEADRLADRIAFLDNGRIVAEGTPAELKRLVPGGQIRLEFADLDTFERAAGALGQPTRSDDDLALQLPGGGIAELRAVLDRLDASSITVDGLSIRTPDLDDVFLSLTGRPVAVGEVETDTVRPGATESTGAAR